MARVLTPEVSNVSLQAMLDAGLNAFAVELLVESYAGKSATPPPITFVYRGVVVSLRPWRENEIARSEVAEKLAGLLQTMTRLTRDLSQVEEVRVARVALNEALDRYVGTRAPESVEEPR